MAALLFKSLLVGFLYLASASPLAKRAYPSTGHCTGTCSGRLHDPSVVYRADTKTYYRFTTNDRITIATAPAMSGPWTPRGAALPSGSIINLPGNQDLWAPDVFHFGGTYYMYYSVSAIGSQNSDIGVATSPTMDTGSWTDHGSIGIPTNSTYNRIDPNLFQHSAFSQPLLTFGSFWQNIFQVPMSNPPLKVAGSVTHLAQNTTRRASPLVNGAQEGSYQFQWGGFYYLFLSAGNCCDEPVSASKPKASLSPAGEEYHILVCRSASPSAGFVDRDGRDCLTQSGGTMVLSSHGNVYAPGGQGVLYDPNLGSPVIYYHYVNPSVSYSYDDFYFGWNRLDFSSGWPVVVA